jgi:hypothetical protein
MVWHKVQAIAGLPTQRCLATCFQSCIIWGAVEVVVSACVAICVAQGSSNSWLANSRMSGSPLPILYNLRCRRSCRFCMRCFWCGCALRAVGCWPKPKDVWQHAVHFVQLEVLQCRKSCVTHSVHTLLLVSHTVTVTAPPRLQRWMSGGTLHVLRSSICQPYACVAAGAVCGSPLLRVCGDGGWLSVGAVCITGVYYGWYFMVSYCQLGSLQCYLLQSSEVLLI